jgi:hypothetical protein
MSEISSVKHNSFNSGFVNSRSEIAKMFEKGEKYERECREKEMRRDENRKDIVDEYILLNQNMKGEKSKLTEKNINAKEHNVCAKVVHNSSCNKVSKNYPQGSGKMLESRSRLHSTIHNSPNMHKNNSGLFFEVSNVAAFNKFE